jgi:uncharacterized Zn finger protein (UPF0148 family)
MENGKITIPELLTFKYLTESIRPFRTIYKQFLKNLKVNVLHGAPRVLKTLADELAIRFILIFIRNHRDTWMGFENEPLSNLFSPEEWIAICEHWKNDEYALSILTLDRYLDRRFRQSLTKDEMNLLLTDFETSLNDAKEILDSAKLFLDAIRDSLKKGELTHDAVINFLNSNIDDKTPEAYRRCMAFFEKFPIEYQKSLVDALMIERNYLSRLHDLPAHFQAVEGGLFNYFLKTLETHARKLGKVLGKRMEDHLGDVYEVYYSILGKFKRQPGGHFEHYLNRYLHRERKHMLTDREKTIFYDDVTCPLCGFDLTETVDGKKSGSVVCPVCRGAVGVWAFENALWQKTPFIRLPAWSRDELEEGVVSDKPFSNLDDVVRAIEEGEGNEEAEEQTVFDPPTLDQFLMDVPLTPKERELVENIREMDASGLSMSKILRQIAANQGKSDHTILEHYKNAVKKLKNMSRKGK